MPHKRGLFLLISNRKLWKQFAKPQKRGLFLLISNRKLWKQFASTVSCFQRLSILGQFPAFLLHTSVHKALSITVPGTLSVWSSLFELSMEFSSKLRGRVAEDSYIPCSPLLVGCSLTTMHALAHWHSYIPITLGGKDQVGSPRDNCPGVLYCPCVL